jgi:2-dehydro-3-deoxyphosphogluconate aldolase / (4S)-4-hydroxy-2-oxoglutarate aldolase
MNIRNILQLAPVIPVITIEDIAHALPLAEALLEGGLPVLEITLRTPAALSAISAIRQRFPAAVVGAGTIVDRHGVAQARDAGAQFLVSPGATPALLQAAADSLLPLLPGASTASEVLLLLEHGISNMKFFPAEAAGGISMLKSLGAPLPQALFCPTGGITLDKAPAYLALPNVACVGGSWMVTPQLLQEGRWADVRKAAAEAAALAS